MSTQFSINRRRFLGLSGALATTAALGSLTGCGSNAEGGSGGTGDGPATITFLYLGSAAKQKQWTALLDEFMRMTPDVKVRSEALPVATWGDFTNQVASRIAAGQAPDIVQVAMAGQRLLASKGVLEPLDDYIARDKAFVDEYLADVNPSLIKGFEKYTNRDGKTYFLPAEFNTVTMWCNKEVFAKAGVKIPGPTETWTWDEFLTVCKTIKDKTGAYGYNFKTDYPNAVLPWLTSAGASSMDGDWKAPTVNTPAAVKAATFGRQLVAEGLAPKPGGTFDEASAFARGELAMFGGGRFRLVELKGVDAVDKAEITRWPQLTSPDVPLNWNGYPILNSSKNKEAAWKLIKFVLSAHAQEYLAELGGATTPSRRSVATGKAFTENAPKGTDLLYETLDHAIPVPSPDRGPEVERAVNEAWTQILVGNVEPQAGMDNLQKTLLGLV